MTGPSLEPWLESGTPLNKSQEGRFVEIQKAIITMTPVILIGKVQPHLASFGFSLIHIQVFINIPSISMNSHWPLTPLQAYPLQECIWTACLAQVWLLVVLSSWMMMILTELWGFCSQHQLVEEKWMESHSFCSLPCEKQITPHLLPLSQP